MRLKDKAVLVTGAAGLIGREVCQLLAAHGARLAVTDVDDDALGAVLSDLGADAAWGRRADAAAYEDFADFAAEASRRVGSPEVLVNVAGLFRMESFVSSAPAGWQQMIAANLLTALVACRAVLPGMVEAGTGSIVNFASTAGEYGSIRPAAAYAAAKAGVIGFTKSLAREVSPSGVRVNAISPGPIDTPAFQLASPEDRKAAEARTLLGRMGRPLDIAQGVLYLACDESAFVTGTVLQVNGGSLL
jgi:NAD(P)-dependent dehydrogenase (short-subunit alcohol dehydrogenase family)